MKVLLLQSDPAFAHPLAKIFEQRGDDVSIISDFDRAIELVETANANLVILDLHLPEDILTTLLNEFQRNSTTKLMISVRYPDLERELAVKKHYVGTFLRAPYNRAWIEEILTKTELPHDDTDLSGRSIQAMLPKIRLPVRMQIILPYLLLALLLAMGAGYLISRVALDTIENRFVNNLIEVGQLTSAWMVEEENSRLETLRLLTFTEGLADAIRQQDAERLRSLTLGLAVNNQEEAITILNADGTSLLSLRHIANSGPESFVYAKGETGFTHYSFIQKVLNLESDAQGDKFAGLVQEDSVSYFYVAGPVKDTEGQIIGVVLVGRSVPTLVWETRANLLGEQNTLAHISIYTMTGQSLNSTLLENDRTLPEDLVALILSQQDQESLLRPITMAGIRYREIVGPWEVRGGDDIGLIGVSLAEHYLVQPSAITQLQIFIIATLGFLLIIITGIFLAGKITNPLKQVVKAAADVSLGKLDTSIEPQGSNELTFLAHAFNYMISHLREGEIYRDLLGRAISPQVREQLRGALASGNLKLEGQRTVATVMITDIRKFTVIAENESPTTVLEWLNQYYGELVPLIIDQDGVTNEFAGDSLMAFFGVLPVPLPSSESAFQACRAAVNMIEAIEVMNEQRQARGEPTLITGIGINTGDVAAGGMGTSSRIHYTIIGDTVNVSQRLEDLTRQTGETSALISQQTFDALGEYQSQFDFIPMGKHIFKGKSEPITVYRIFKQFSEAISSQSSQRMNINQATRKELTQVKGINTKRAETILQFRNSNGDFSTIHDLTHVHGIGKTLMERLKLHFWVS